MSKLLPARLCEKCQALRFDDAARGGIASTSDKGRPLLKFPNDSDQTFRVDVWSDTLPDLPELRQYAENGCDFCCVLREAVLRSKLDFAGTVNIQLDYKWRPAGVNEWGLNALLVSLGLEMEEKEATERREDFDKYQKYDEDGHVVNWNYSILFTIESGSGRLHCFTHSIFNSIETTAGNCTEWLSLEPAPMPKALSEENISLIRKEMNRCLQDCHPPEESTFMPTRLLDLGHDDTDEVHLIETSNLSGPVRYSALSYCWGPPEDACTQLKTETTTLARRKCGIPFDIMPRVMQDAVKTARALSIQYIWIDALCIIQDDKQDWQREAANMGLVYSHAILTVCALGSSSCHQGFLDRSAAVISIPFQSKIDISIEGSYTLRAHPIKKHQQLLRDSEVLDHEESSWSTRAWTFQEFELSTRILFFGRSRIHFMCPLKTWMEGDYYTEPYLQPFGQAILAFRRGEISREKLYSTWLTLLERYGDRCCTFASDKLPAISGLAKLIAEETGDTYIAGVWNSDLISGLLWSYFEALEHASLEHHLDIFAQTDIPSWTWVTQTKRFSYGHSLFFLNNDDDLQSECEQIQAWSDADDTSLNPFGHAINARLAVTGKTLVLNRDLERVPVGQFRQVWKATFDDTYTAWLELDYTVHHTIQRLPVKFKLLLLGSVTGFPHPNQNLDLTADGEHIWEDSDSDMDSDIDSDEGLDDECRHAWGLLLHPAKDANQCYRVGIFTVRAAKLGGLAFFHECKYEDVEVL